jgi:hypothetical protein
MKLLFISIRDVNRKTSGGEKCTNRNYLSFCEVFGNENVEVFNIAAYRQDDWLKTIARRLDFFRGYYAGLTSVILKRILSRSADFDYIFIDASYLGILAYHLKIKGYKGKIISFFHNIEVSVIKQKAHLNFIHSWKTLPVYYNEKMAVKHSDTLVTLTGKDLEALKNIYHAADAEVIPISLPDEYVPGNHGITGNPPSFLFVGDNWFPNIHGIRWFIKNVLDHADIMLLIAGRNMERFRDEFAHPKVRFLGFVDNLPKAIGEADYFLCPIFRGGGMKVKICEALMHGKTIFGTTEAFEGYNTNPEDIGALCNTAGEFIDAIELLCRIPREKFNAKSRETFLENYSYSATLNLFKNLLQ